MAVGWGDGKIRQPAKARACAAVMAVSRCMDDSVSDDGRRVLPYRGGKADEKQKKTALIVYGVQLAFNFAWTLIFFNAGAYLFAFIWLIVLWLLIIVTIYLFSNISFVSALLLVPYALWVAFAGYLNFMIYRLN